MDREDIMQEIAEYFHIEPNDEGEYDIESYNWQAGCYIDSTWFSPAEVVYCIEEIINRYY